jgi:hypothetical protein
MNGYMDRWKDRCIHTRYIDLCKYRHRISDNTRHSSHISPVVPVAPFEGYLTGLADPLIIVVDRRVMAE